MPVENPKIFFSYARADAEFVAKLAKDLRSVGTSLWLDQLDIPTGDRWDQAVEVALKASPCLLVILSSTSVASHNVMDEVSFALEENKKILPILYQNCEIPFRLRRLQHIDFTVNYDTGFAELRKALGVQPGQTPLPSEPPTSRTASEVKPEEKGTLAKSPVSPPSLPPPSSPSPPPSLAVPPRSDWRQRLIVLVLTVVGGAGVYYLGKVWFEKAPVSTLTADQANAEAQFNQGVSYDNGEGVAQDKAEALKWYRKAADQGHAEAQFYLGVSYDDGEGVAQDQAEAVKWYRKAADQGHAKAQLNLGVSYDKGEGVAKNKAEAVKWYRKAADQGNAEAQFYLGVSYDDGEGVAQDKAEAEKWYRKAADQEHAEAQFYLGVIYQNGEGVVKNKAEAVKWYRKAADQGNADAKKALRAMK